MKLVNTLVVHENAMPLGSSAVMNCVINNLPLKMEISGQTSYGLSHRGLGDNTDALCTLFETCNPCHGQLPRQGDRGAGEGRHLGQLSGHASGRGCSPNSYDFDESGWPIEKRTAYHMSMSAEIINTFDQMYPDKPLKISGLPDANEMIANGLEATLKSLA